MTVPLSASSHLIRGLVSRLRTNWKELGWVALGHAISLIGNFGGVKILTHFLLPAAYGELAMGMTVAGLISSLVYSPLANALVRLFSVYADRGELSVHLHAFRRLVIRISLLVAGILSGAAACVAWAFDLRWGAVVAAGGLYAIGNGLAMIYTGYSTARRRRSVIVTYQALDACGRPLLAVACVLAFAPTGEAALLGYCAAGALNAFAQIYRKESDPELTQAELAPAPAELQAALFQQALFYAGPLAVTAIFSSISTYGDRWTLQGLLGPADLGIYTALVQIGNTPSALFSSVVGAFIVPIAFQRAGAQQSKERVRSSIRLLVVAALLSTLVAIPAIAAFALLGPQIAALLTAPQYVSGAGILWIVCSAGFVLAIGRTLLLAAEVLQQTRQLYLPWIVNAILTVVLSLGLGRRHGITGIAVGLLLSNLACALVGAWIAWRLTREALARPEEQPA